MASSSYVIRQLIPTLAPAFARLRRTPGRHEGWLEEALRALEGSDAPRYHRMRRRIGFARRFGALARLDIEESATLTLGLFFHELADRQPARSRSGAGSAWLEYLLRNEDWLAPAFKLCETIATDGWESLETKAEAVAKVTAVFDSEILERHERPLQVLQQLMEEIGSELAEEVIPLLWSEEGQALCDHHFRRHPRGYKLEASDLRRSFEVLRKTAPQRAAEELAVAPFRLSGSAARPADQAPEQTPARKPVAAPRSRAAARPSSPVPAGANFDRRREALRARTPFGLQEAVKGSPPHQNDDRQPAERTPAPVVAEQPARDEARMARRFDEQPHRDDVRPAEGEEKTMEQTRTISSLPPPPGRRDALEMMQKLQDVRLQLGQIQRVALDAEQLLTGLAPQLDELAAWITDLDAVVDRWRGRPDIERAA